MAMLRDGIVDIAVTLKPARGEKLVFDTHRYFDKLGVDSLYPSVILIFRTAPGQAHYHLPLLLSPFGYTTYRGL